MDHVAPFDYENVAGRIAFGRGRTAELGDSVAEAGGERALVVCGSNVGANRDTMAPVESGLGDSLAGVFDGTTPDKDARAVTEGVAAMADHDADALVAVGGGSSIDVARAMRAVAVTGHDADEFRAYVAEHGTIPVPDASLPPLVAVPTTLAGADCSTGGSVTFYGDGDEETLSGGYGDPRLMPDAVVYDPVLFETTPTGALVGSAMNGFDKGLEALYSRHASPLTDAPAIRGLQLLTDALPGVTDPADESVLERVVAGIVLVQYPRATVDGGLLSLIHAFGHGLRGEGVQQGVAHAVMAPPALELLFESVDGRRDLLATALGVTDAENTASAVVDAVAAVRDGLGLPARLREVDEVERDALPTVARRVAEDQFVANAPEGFDPSREDLLDTLEATW
ncbi:iron-containing alcohol dehydrogenase family protein [Halomarina oriensis]|uniref:Iron-containing alcohol dehydrogenase n=1 Tax=Halomarina oriensis TaxID=671145 RepID=A0A6B0GQ38_9EURY|nr:iron-containing alcohol dehydrogenase family protein [Halomarina oriensis]MWG36171.1 iron-containing alcohol dehydrogenase [Halomarina oriensis]